MVWEGTDGRTTLPSAPIPINGRLVEAAEVFDPATGRFADLVGAPPGARALHTATVLTDGRLAIVGGVAATDEALDSVELWDVRTRRSERLASYLTVPRYAHAATLLPNGVVLLWGGFDRDGNVLSTGELFDLALPRGLAVDVPLPPADAGPPRVEESVPADGSQGVATDVFVAVRFSKPILVAGANAATVLLTGPDGNVAVRVVPTEGGMLLFLVPEAPLRPGTTYTVTLQGLTDELGEPLGPTTLQFATVAAGGHQDGAATGTVPGAPAPAEAASGADEEWRPHSTDPEDGWRTGRPVSRWESLPPLHAQRGVTALAGQVLRLNGEPLPGVKLEMEGHSTRTDPTGRFLLPVGSEAGWCELWIDGGATHGTYEVAVVVEASRTNVLPYTIWLPKLDLAHAVTIPSPTTEETVISNPTMPGLEVHLPPGTVIRDHAGKVVRRVSLTPIPLDRPPFPLPNIPVPIYFTLQPGGSYIYTPTRMGARVFYPNVHHAPAGTRFDFWNYDPEERGWYIYGQGTVGQDGGQVIPDPYVMIYEFSGAMINCNGAGCPAGPPPPGAATRPATKVPRGLLPRRVWIRRRWRVRQRGVRGRRRRRWRLRW